MNRSTSRDARQRELLGRAAAAGLGSTLDQLEPRYLMVVMPSGYFMDISGMNFGGAQPNEVGPGIRVILQDDNAEGLKESLRPTVEIIGSTLDSGNGGRLNDVPTTVYSLDQLGVAARDRQRALNLMTDGRNLGGTAGRIGIIPVARNGTAPARNAITDPIRGISWGNQALPTSRLTTVAQAATAKGATYSIDDGRITFGSTTVRFLRLIRQDLTTGTGEVVDYLDQKILNALGPKANGDPLEIDDIKSIQGMDFDDVDANGSGNLYFVAVVSQPRRGEDGTFADTDIPVLFEYRKGVVRYVSEFDPNNGFVGSNPAPLASTVDDFAMGPNRTVYWFGSAKTVTGTGDDTGVRTFTGVFSSQLFAGTNGRTGMNEYDAARPANINFGGTNLDDVEALEYDQDRDVFYILDQQGADASLIVVQNITANGDIAGRTLLGSSYGSLDADIADSSGGRVLGENLPDLTYNPAVRSKFDGSAGVIVSEDTNADVLVYIDTRERYTQTGIYSIIVKNSTPTTKLIIESITLQDNVTGHTEPMGTTAVPFAGDAGDVQVFLPDKTNLSTGSGTGALFLGQRRPDPEIENSTDQVLPITSISTTTFASAIPQTLIDLGITELTPGITVLPRTLTKKGKVVGKQATGLDTLFFGGTITGSVYVDGRVNNFYAGNVITGNGLGGFGAATRNFSIQGDLRSFNVKGSVGTLDDNASFASGFDMYVNGKGVQYDVGNDFSGAMRLTGNGRYGADFAPSELSFDDGFTEREVRVRNANAAAVANAFQAGTLLDPSFYNDTSATREILGTYFDTSRDKGQQVQVTGSIDAPIGDAQDWFGLPVMAGQTFDVSLTSAIAVMDVFDPEGRLYYRMLPGDSQQITADKAGTWTFSVRMPTGIIGSDSYGITINRGGDLTLGGLTTGGTMLWQQGDGHSLTVDNGDLGLLEAASATIEQDSLADDLTVSKGNLRTIYANEIARTTNTGAIVNIPNLRVPGGSVGRVEAVTDLSLNDRAIDLVTNDPILSYGVGQDYQLVTAGGDVAANLIANRGIGVIRGATLGSRVLGMSGFWRDDADNTGDGFIDLINASGDIGDAISGGPAIQNGPGGNVRYMVAGGTVYRDFFFGNGVAPSYQATGKSVDVQDDSGSTISFTPLNATALNSTDLAVGDGTTTGGSSPTTAFSDPFGGFSATNPFTGLPTVITDPVADPLGNVVAQAYPIRSGGSVVFAASASEGLKINTSGGGKRASAEIGTVTSASLGAPIIFTAATVGTSTTPAVQASVDFNIDTGVDLQLRVTGKKTSIWNVTGSAYTSILNNTDGEIVGTNVTSVGLLEANRLGTAVSSTGQKLDGVTTILGGAAYPFNQQKTGLIIGDAIRIRSRTSLGNLVMSGQAVRVEANSDNKNVKGVFEGINAPVQLGTGTRFVNIGEGVGATGSGDTSLAGIYATGSVGEIANQGLGSDIRGDIVIGNYLDHLTLTDGSIIGAHIYRSLDFTTPLTEYIVPGSKTVDDPLVGVDPTTSNAASFDFPVAGEFRAIDLKGKGGIIGSTFSAATMGAINISGGFGFITSELSARSDATFGGIVTDGLGIRNSVLTGGRQVANVVAHGTTGKLLSIADYSGSVRYSRSKSPIFDPYSGRALDANNDIYKALNMPRGPEKLSGVTNEGIIENTIMRGGRELSNLEAFQIRASQTADIAPTGSLFPMQINYADRIKSFKVHESVQGLGLVTGRLDSMSIGADARLMSVTTSGPIGTVTIGKNFKGTSSIHASGPSGTIGTVDVRGSMFGAVTASVSIGTVKVGRGLGSVNVTSGGSFGTLNVGGDVLNGTIVRATGKMGSLIVGGDVDAGATIRASSYGSQQIKGTVFGDILVG
ncbi:MAG: hypothetical protein QM770_22260 [Tepidisphaeraceae bacterium]